METKLELIKKEFVAKHPVGTRILWDSSGEAARDDNWLPGVVIEARSKHPEWDPCIWFVLDRDDKELKDVNYHARLVSYKYQHLLKLAE